MASDLGPFSPATCQDQSISSVISFLPAEVWHNPDRRLRAVERCELELLYIVDGQGLKPIGDVDVFGVPASDVDPKLSSDLVMIKLSVRVVPGS